MNFCASTQVAVREWGCELSKDNKSEQLIIVQVPSTNSMSSQDYMLPRQKEWFNDRFPYTEAASPVRFHQSLSGQPAAPKVKTTVQYRLCSRHFLPHWMGIVQNLLFWFSMDPAPLSYCTILTSHQFLIYRQTLQTAEPFSGLWHTRFVYG
jgi:hypothetical protein